METKKKTLRDWAGIAAVITAVSTGVVSLVSQFRSDEKNTLTQKSMMMVIEYRLQLIEHKLGIRDKVVPIVAPKVSASDLHKFVPHTKETSATDGSSVMTKLDGVTKAPSFLHASRGIPRLDYQAIQMHIQRTGLPFDPGLIPDGGTTPGE